MAVSNQTNAHGARKFPGIDLHLHLDGALTPEMLLTLGALSGTNLPAQTPEALRPFVTVDERCTSLVEYLERFNVTLSVLQTREAIAEAVRMLLLRLHEQGLLYAEIRFAPQLHLQRGLTQCQVVEAATEGLLKAGAQCAPLKAQLILCCMRFDENRSENLETIRTTAAFLGRGVCAADLAGGEIGHPATAYAEAFELAAKLGVPYTIHGGEAAGPQSIREALSIGAQRIGHGVHAAGDEALLALLAERKIPLEMCPTSNLHTKAVSSLHDYPVRDFLHRGIVATINTDNPGISQTTLAQEFDSLRVEAGLTLEEQKTLLIHAARAAFLPQDEKEALLAAVEAALAEGACATGQ